MEDRMVPIQHFNEHKLSDNNNFQKIPALARPMKSLILKQPIKKFSVNLRMDKDPKDQFLQAPDMVVKRDIPVKKVIQMEFRDSMLVLWAQQARINPLTRWPIRTQEILSTC